MTKRTFKSVCIALEQLETALRLYHEGQEYFSVITLASAAEEIIGKQCRAKGIKTSLESIKKGSLAMYKHLYGNETDDSTLEKQFADRANSARNKAKHVNPGVEPTLTIDPKEEARDMLNRAIDNYWALEQDLTPAMKIFTNEQRSV